jgi:hypothetical protein
MLRQVNGLGLGTITALERTCTSEVLEAEGFTHSRQMASFKQLFEIGDGAEIRHDEIGSSFHPAEVLHCGAHNQRISLGAKGATAEERASYEHKRSTAIAMYTKI